jgi:hypothetical protein
MRLRQVFVLLALCCFHLGTARADIPHQIPIQGRLADSTGTPVDSGLVTFTFRLMDDSSGGVEVWPGTGGEARTLFVSDQGLWQASLGAVDPLPDSIFTQDTVRWLEITVDDGTTLETLPRIRVAAGAYAYQAAFAQQAENAALLDGMSPGDFATTAHTHVPLDVTPQGDGSGLDADLLDGLEAVDFAPTAHGHIPDSISPQGEGSGLDADLLDGLDAAEFAALAHLHVPAAIDPQGDGSGLDADLLDGQEATDFAGFAHGHAGLWSINGPNYFFNGGRVGVGTTSPENMLHVLSGAGTGVIPNSASVGIFEADNIGYLSLITPDFAERGLLFAEPASAMAGGIIYNNAQTPDGIQFRTAFNVTGMALESSGRLSLGTFTGVGALQVVGFGLNSSVVLPGNSIATEEILNEAGIATNVNGAIVTLVSTTMQAIVTVTITIPVAGYIHVEAKCNGTTYNTSGRNQGTVQIVEGSTGFVIPPYFATFGLVGHASAGLANSFPVYLQRVYFKAAGTYTFQMEAAQNTSNGAGAITKVGQSILTATYFPTGYGDANTIVESGEALDFATAVPTPDGQGFKVDLRELEIRALKARAEAQEAELKLERARAKSQAQREE